MNTEYIVSKNNLCVWSVRVLLNTTNELADLIFQVRKKKGGVGEESFDKLPGKSPPRLLCALLLNGDW